MEITATSKYIRISPEKLRYVVTGIKKGFSANNGLVYLSAVSPRGGSVIAKTLKQAIANAQNNYGKKTEDLKIKLIKIDSGPFLKRFTAVSRGMAHSIHKRMSHVTVILEAPEESKKEKTNV